MPNGLRGFQKGNNFGKIYNIGNKYGLGGKSRRGQKRSIEERKKQSLTMTGRKHSEKTKRKIGLANSISLKGKFIKENNPNWKGGNWNSKKIEVKVRDNYTCQICGLRDIEIMEVDHIKPKKKFPELFLVSENLITLCPNCHRRKTNRELKNIYNILII